MTIHIFQTRVPNTRTDAMYEAISLPEVMFEPSRLRLREFLDRLLTGMSWQPMQSVDPFVSEAVLYIQISSLIIS